MYMRWEDERPLADGPMIAELYKVSERSVRRHCTPAKRLPQSGQPRGMCGMALYDAITAAESLATVSPRSARVAAALSARYGT